MDKVTVDAWTRTISGFLNEITETPEQVAIGNDTEAEWRPMQNTGDSRVSKHVQRRQTIFRVLT